MFKEIERELSDRNRNSTQCLVYIVHNLSMYRYFASAVEAGIKHPKHHLSGKKITT